MDLRPLSLGELFDRAFMLYRRHFVLFVGITAVPGVFALIMTLAQQGVQTATVAAGNAAKAGTPAPENLGIIIGLFAGMMFAMVAYWIVYMVALGATTFAVSEIYVGRPVTIPQVYGRMRGRVGALVILMLLIGLRIAGIFLAGALFIGVAFAIGSGGGVAGSALAVLATVVISFALAAVVTWMTLRYGVSVPALVLEGLPPGESITRSIELTRGRLGRVFLLVVCSSLVTYAGIILFQGPFFGAAMVVGLESTTGFWLNIVGAIFGTIAATLTTPFMIIGLALIYYDARIREEGFDLELALAALDSAADPARA
jgi:hypothetical protein